MSQYYTFDELRELGCPNELLMQYVLVPKTVIDEMLKDAQMIEDESL